MCDIDSLHGRVASAHACRMRSCKAACIGWIPACAVGGVQAGTLASREGRHARMESLLSDLSRDELDEDNLSSDVAPIDRSDVGMVVRTLDSATCVRRAGGGALKTLGRNRLFSPVDGCSHRPKVR